MKLTDVAKLIRDDIDAYCVERYGKNSKHRTHLGASEIGEECARYLWYSFHWYKEREPFDARMLRLFQRGHLEEKRFNEYLDAIGFERQPVTHVEIGNPHFGGTPDGAVGIIPKYFPYPVLLEFKTWNTKGFVELSRVGVKSHAPKHYAQMCTYGKAYEINHALYFAVNKNDDDLHIELVELDMQFADDMLRKAEYVIESPTPPRRIAEQPTFYKCRFCYYKDVCHEGVDPIINCRTCQFATPDSDGSWYCNYHLDTIPPDWVVKGCNHWVKRET